MRGRKKRGRERKLAMFDFPLKFSGILDVRWYFSFQYYQKKNRHETKFSILESQIEMFSNEKRTSATDDEQKNTYGRRLRLFAFRKHCSLTRDKFHSVKAYAMILTAARIQSEPICLFLRSGFGFIHSIEIRAHQLRQIYYVFFIAAHHQFECKNTDSHWAWMRVLVTRARIFSINSYLSLKLVAFFFGGGIWFVILLIWLCWWLLEICIDSLRCLQQ